MVEITRASIETWIESVATGEFYYKNVLGLNGHLDPVEDNKLRKVMFDICHAKEPKAEPVGRHDGYYRPIDNTEEEVDWQSVSEKTEFPLLLPFDLRNYVFIYPNTVSIVAGSKSSGKTGFLMRTVVMNMYKTNTILLSNMEGGKEQLRDRFMAMNDIRFPTPAPFKTYYVTDNFHDHIRKPKTLYVIDYIDAPDNVDFFKIGGAITRVQRKMALLGGCAAVIGLQKPSSRDVAVGGEGTLKDATLYIAMDNKKLKIVDAKVPANKTKHPKNMQWTFTYNDEGTNFENIQPFYG